MSNIDFQKNAKYFFCPSGNCLNIPQINYSFNPLKTDFKYSCSCHNNINSITEIELKEFLERTSSLNCSICKKKIFDEQIIYCIECNVLLDKTCVQIHHKDVKHTQYIQLNKNIFNYCLEHKSPFIFRCIDCKKSLCNKCNFSFHDDNGHKLEQIKKFSINQNDFQRIHNNFKKQKSFLKKIIEINNNLMQKLENDIELKERMINNFLLNKLDYNSLINMNNIYIENNQKYEKILDEILFENEEINDMNNNTLNSKDYINQYMAPLLYSMMINKEENLNDSLINELQKNVYIFQPLISQKNEQINIDNQLLEGNINNYNILGNSKNNSKILFEKDNPYKNNDLNNNNINYSQDDFSSQQINVPKLNIPNFGPDNTKEKYENLNFSWKFDSRKNQYSNFNFSINNDNNNNKNNYTNSSQNYGRKNILNNSKLSLSQTSSEKSNNNKSSKRIKSKSQRKFKRKTQTKKPKKNEESNISSENHESYSENESKKETGRKINNYINNMIVLKSGNVAVSIREAIEIYNLRKLNFSGTNYFYNNDLIQNKCLLQRINIVKNRKISYVFELFDETLLCATYSKIFRIKLTTNDTNYEIMSFLQLGTSELPTKIISLDKSFLVILSEQKKNCNIKIFQKIDDERNEDNTNENNINENKEEFNKPINKNDNSSNMEDVPAIGNCDLFATKDIKEDTTYKIFHKNINEIRRLWVSIFPLEKAGLNKKSKSLINDEEDNYLYEFIATSNAIYDLGKNKIAFYGIKIDKRNNEYIVTKIKELDGLSCSAEADSICQINEKYICVGLQNHNLNGQVSGFAFVDIYKRNLCGIVNDQEISCIFYNMKNNLLFASMEVRDPKGNYFMSKIYNIINVKNDRGDEEIQLKKLFQHKNNQTDIITSIQQITIPYFKVNLEQQNILDNIIFATSCKDSTMEVVKAVI